MPPPFTVLFTRVCCNRVMAGTQAPKGFALLFIVVGIPLIIWSATNTNAELEALDASSSTEQSRLAACEAKTVKLRSDPTMRRRLCGCIVSKAAERGAFKDYGSYDEALLAPVVSECAQSDRLPR